jgi:hypothetical protein
MAELSAAGRAAAALTEQKETIARSVTGLLYAEMPWLHDRYGERGRARCLQDLRYHVEHLVPAVEMEAPGTFAGYAAWCDGVLHARGIPTAELLRCLELMESDVAVRLRGEEAAAAVAALRAGIDALGAAEASA